MQLDLFLKGLELTAMESGMGMGRVEMEMGHDGMGVGC